MSTDAAGGAPPALLRNRLRRRPRDEFVVPRNGRQFTRAIVRIGEQSIMLLLAVFSLAPLYAMIVISLKPTAEFRADFASLALPDQPTFEKFVEAWSGLGFASLVRTSLIFAVTSSLVTTALAATAGFALARGEFAGRRALLVLFIALISVPAIVVVVPLFELMATLGLINTYPAAITAEIGLLVPFATYLVYTFVREIPSELFNAAAVDGASASKQLWTIGLPLSRPVLATVALISAVWAWNDLLVPLILWQSEDLKVLMVGLANLAPGRAGGVDIPLVMAGVAISVVPIVVLFVIAKRFFIKGLVEGALK
jgi:ABC-type glycerol-3-phosphate transport system permease component